MLSWLNQLFDELGHIQEIPKLAVSLVATTAGGGVVLSGPPVENPDIEPAKRSGSAKEPTGDCGWPAWSSSSYSLGGSDILIYANPNWTTQDTAKRVELDWNRLANIEAYAVLLMRTEGEFRVYVGPGPHRKYYQSRGGCDY